MVLDSRGSGGMELGVPSPSGHSTQAREWAWQGPSPQAMSCLQPPTVLQHRIHQPSRTVLHQLRVLGPLIPHLKKPRGFQGVHTKTHFPLGHIFHFILGVYICKEAVFKSKFAEVYLSIFFLYIPVDGFKFSPSMLQDSWDPSFQPPEGPPPASGEACAPKKSDRRSQQRRSWHHLKAFTHGITLFSHASSTQIVRGIDLLSPKVTNQRHSHNGTSGLLCSLGKWGCRGKGSRPHQPASSESDRRDRSQDRDQAAKGTTRQRSKDRKSPKRDARRDRDRDRCQRLHCTGVGVQAPLWYCPPKAWNM